MQVHTFAFRERHSFQKAFWLLLHDRTETVSNVLFINGMFTSDSTLLLVYSCCLWTCVCSSEKLIINLDELMFVEHVHFYKRSCGFARG